MRICIITSSFPLNPTDARASAGLFVKDVALAIAEAGHSVTVVTPDKQGGEKRDPPGISVRWFHWRGGHETLSSMKPYRPADALAMVSLFRQGRRELDELAARERPDHVLAMWAVPAGYLAMGLKARRGIPFTVWCLGSDIWTYGRYPILRGVVRRVLRAADLLYADGLELARQAERLAERRCAFLPSSRRLNRGLIKSLNLPDRGFRFLFVGRYAPVKGVDVLLEAMARFVREGNRGCLYMFGGGPLDDYVRERAGRRDLREHVSVGGYADEEMVVSYLEACDTLLIPSRMESIPVIFSDALHMNRPLVVSDVGDMGELLRQVPAGLVCPPEDAEALFRAMQEMATGGVARFAPHIRSLAGRFDVARATGQWTGEIAALGDRR